MSAGYEITGELLEDCKSQYWISDIFFTDRKTTACTAMTTAKHIVIQSLVKILLHTPSTSSFENNRVSFRL